MKGLNMAVLALLLAVFMLGATLQRKQMDEWGEHAPCTEAIEDIAAEVNERLGGE
jgi:hypothetical protein